MSRFAASMAALETDGAMIEYRRNAERDPYGLDPAEWIAALHAEHFATLALLRESEPERVARIMAGLQLVIRQATVAENEISKVRSQIGDVLGDTPAVEALRDACRELRRSVISSLQEMVQDGRS